MVPLSDRPHPRSDLRAVLRLRAALSGADVVHAHGVRAGALVVLAARSRLRRPRVVVTLHNAPPGDARLARVFEALEQAVARGADAVLVVSGDLGDRVRRLGARGVERALVPTPALSRSAGRSAQDVRADLGVPASQHLVVVVARLAAQKGLPLLLDAVAHVTSTRPELDLSVAIAGDGPMDAELASLIRAKNLPVRLLGRRDDVPDLLAAADVAVLPSVWEGQPLVAQEALRAGAPLVATAVRGTQEVTGAAAVFVPYGDPAALGDAVADLLQDPGRRAAMRSAALARAARLPSDDDAVAQLLAAYAG
jgi:glycosyltransferase involved in cell wall biosynthesis